MLILFSLFSSSFIRLVTRLSWFHEVCFPTLYSLWRSCSDFFPFVPGGLPKGDSWINICQLFFQMCCKPPRSVRSLLYHCMYVCLGGRYQSPNCLQIFILLCWFLRNAVTEYRGKVSWTTESCYLTVVEAGSPNSSIGRLSFSEL